MQAREAIIKRRSVRSYIAKPVPQALIEDLVDCARLSPSARNVQPWAFVAVSDKEMLSRIAGLSDNGRFISDCGCCIAVFCQETKYYLEDGSAATQNILIRAHDLGLAACWVAGDKKPYADEVRSLLNAPADYKLVSLVSLGYSETGDATVPTKKSLEEVLHWDKF